MMAGTGWGWHIETALHVLRMILSGVFRPGEISARQRPRTFGI